MNEINQNDDKFARESFSMRQMARWQLWGVTILSIAVVIAILVYAMS